MKLRTIHRSSAVLLLLFVVSHLANHLTSLVSIELHTSALEALRKVYRNPIAEICLLSVAAIQVGTGLGLVFRGWRARVGAVAWVQVLSGLYLSVFLVNHIGAVLYGRFALGLDTNFYFAAAGFQVKPWQWFFGPYYFLAVAAFFTHVGCAAFWMLSGSKPSRARMALAFSAGLGLVVALLLTLSMAGAFSTFTVPLKYKASYIASQGLRDGIKASWPAGLSSGCLAHDGRLGYPATAMATSVRWATQHRLRHHQQPQGTPWPSFA